MLSGVLPLLLMLGAPPVAEAEPAFDASKDEKSQVSFMLFLGGAKDISRKLFENEFGTKADECGEADLIVSAPTLALQALNNRKSRNGSMTKYPLRRHPVIEE